MEPEFLECINLLLNAIFLQGAENHEVFYYNFPKVRAGGIVAKESRADMQIVLYHRFIWTLHKLFIFLAPLRWWAYYPPSRSQVHYVFRTNVVVLLLFASCHISISLFYMYVTNGNIWKTAEFIRRKICRIRLFCFPFEKIIPNRSTTLIIKIMVFRPMKNNFQFFLPSPSSLFLEKQVFDLYFTTKTLFPKLKKKVHKICFKVWIFITKQGEP